MDGRADFSRRSLAGSLLAIVLVHLVLVLPNHVDRITALAPLRLPLELPVLLALPALLPLRAAGRFGLVAGALIGIGVIVKCADMGAFAAFARPFNPVLDAHLLRSALHLLSGAVGSVGAVALAGLAVAAAVLVLALAMLATRRLARIAAENRRPALVLAAAGLAVWSGFFLTGASLEPRRPLASVDTTRILLARGREAVASLSDLQAFRAAAAVDPLAAIADDRLFKAIAGRDVFVIFVESYGRSAIDDPRYRPVVRPVLEDGDRRLAAAGVGVRSAFLTSPTVGGMSWLAHGTLLSGLRVDNQRRYDSLVLSERMSLNRHFRRAGWRTVAAMPAIVMAWPEAGWFGYDRAYVAADLGYRGKAFNWVTMPDQYVLSAMERLELSAPDRPPVMAEIALISSHAPWTPVPRLVDWAAVGDGRIFDAMAVEGDPPDVVWQDTGRVRRQYAGTIAYSLETLVSWIETFGAANRVIVIVGDHQPAPMITGEDAGRAVPVHVLSGDPAAIAALDGFGWSKGLVPAADAPVWPMEDLGRRLAGAWSP